MSSKWWLHAGRSTASGLHASIGESLDELVQEMTSVSRQAVGFTDDT